VSWKQEHLDLFVQKSKEFNFTIDKDLATEEGKREAYRYLLVCHLIPLTKENLALAPIDQELNFDFDDLPKDLQTQIHDAAMDASDQWEYGDIVSTDDLEEKNWYVSSVWIKNGKVKDAKIHKTVVAEVTDSYITPELNLEVP
jgi:hypothetical protein